jgi:acyl carrier protein
VHQRPFSGWIAEADLCALMRRSQPTSAKHRLRNELAFGFPTTVPDDTAYLVVVRGPRQPRARDLGTRWITETPATLHALGERLADPETLLADPDMVDDCWAAAQHHTFRYRRLAADPSRAGADREVLCAAIGSWSRVPRNVRFALDSARRNRPRPTLVKNLFAEVAAADAAARGVLAPAVPAGTVPVTHPVTGTVPVLSEIGVLSEIAMLIGRQRGGPTPQLRPDTGLEEGLRMNSAQVVDLLSELEEHFHCAVRDDDLDSLTHVGDLVAIVERGAAR